MMRVALCVLVALGAGGAHALNETPSSPACVVYQPYDFALGDSGDRCGLACALQSYVVLSEREQIAGLDPALTVDRFVELLELGAGAFYIATHGSESGLAVEVYELSAAGRAARDAAFDAYLAAGRFTADEIYAAASVDGYHISIRPEAVAPRFNGANTIVYNVSCGGQQYEAIAWPASRCRLGYLDSCPLALANEESDTFWGRMNGDAGPAYRKAVDARLGLELRLAGQGETVLSPMVTTVSPGEGTELPEDVAGSVEFDSRMDPSVPASTIVYGESAGGAILVREAEWVTDHRLEFTIRPYRVGDCHLTVDPLARSGGGRWLDGNTDPIGSNGQGPNADPFKVRLHSLREDTVVAAGFEGAWAFRDEAGTHVLWVTDPERGSTAFDLYAGAGRAARVATVPAAGRPDRPHCYEVVIPGAAGPFEVVERDGDPSTECATRPFPLSNRPPDRLDRLRGLNAEVESWAPLETRAAERRPGLAAPVRTARGASEVEVTDFVYYSSRQDFLDATASVRDYWLSAVGATSQVVLGTSDPAECRAVMASIHEAALHDGHPRLPFLVIVGEANEGSEPEKNIVGTFYPPDESGNCFWNCASDAMIVDFDGDKLPDVPWTRIVGCELREIENSVASALDYYEGRDVSPPRAFVLDGDLTMICTALAEPRATLEAIRDEYLARGIPVEIRHDSEYTSCSGWAERLADGAAIVNAGVTELIGIGQTTNRSILPAFIFQKVHDPVFTMAAVPTPQRIVAEFPGCGLGDTDRNNPAYYPSIAKMFLAADPARHTTAVAWLAHMRGGYKTLHLEIARRYFARRFSGEAWSVHDAYFDAIREFGEDEPDARDYLLLAGAFGWPVALDGMTTLGTASDGGAGGGSIQLAPNVPNPLHPSTRIRYVLDRLAVVSLAVYDVRGRLVRTLVDGRTREAGRHEIVWDGADGSGRLVAPGVYFARLTLNGEVALTRKMTVAR
jgi:hypothetical protein